MNASLLRGLRPAPLYVDLGLALVFTVVGVLEPSLRTVDGFDDGPMWLSTVIGAFMGVPLVLRRQAPAVCLLLMCAALALPSLVVAHGDYFWSQLLPLCFAVYPASRLLDGPLGRWGWLVALAAVEVDAVHSHLARVEGGPALPLVLFGGCALAARLARRTAGDAAALSETLARVAEEQSARQEAAVEEERTRIAVEVHDVVAHAVSVMVLQVGAARLGLEQRGLLVPDQLRAAEQTGRDALGELRRSLGLLREEPDKGPLQPLPGVADLGALADRFRAVGLALDLTVDLRLLDEADTLPVGLQLSVYRLVQEGLTNVLKHAGAVPVTASVTLDGDDADDVVAVVVVVQNRRAGEGAEVAPSGGHGLPGMRERVSMYAGELEAGPTDGGFVVRARLPVPGGAAGPASGPLTAAAGSAP
jgi:signal transduction histidine kinase